MSILVTLTPAESKRLIGKALSVHPLVKSAMEHGRILISNGTTTGYFVEELLGEKMDIARFACGVVTGGVQCMSPNDRIRSVYIRNGRKVENDENTEVYAELQAWVDEMGPGDVYVKGANAIDAEGNAGWLLANPKGGNILTALPAITARGVRFLVPTGLEKLVASVPEAGRHMKGIKEYDYTFGLGCGYVTVTNAVIIHEITALEMLTGTKAFHAASGGVGGSEGAVTLVIEGTAEQLEQTAELLKSIKGEPAVRQWKQSCGDCSFRCWYVNS
ncbi:MAG: hypothetical protein J5865_03470 [Lachnospiraceae bacterium]|nr:hypothetical protein [Lachnospiraceae bacterium]